MASTISFIQANLQHSIAASRFLTRTASVKGNDMALIQEPWYREVEYSRLYPVLCKRTRKTTSLHPNEGRGSLDATGILL